MGKLALLKIISFVVVRVVCYWSVQNSLQLKAPIGLAEKKGCQPAVMSKCRGWG